MWDSSDFSPTLATAYGEFRASGGVVDICQLEEETRGGGEEEENHRYAAIEGLRVFEERIKMSRSRFEVTITGDPRGKQISTDEFLGPFYDEKARSLILRGSSPNFLNRYFAPPYEEGWHTVVKVPESSDPAVRGFAQAFSEPPYGLGLSRAMQNELFSQIMVQLLGDLESAVINSWSADWSNYFDAGKEWWGAYFWTIRRNDGIFVCIGASSTD